MTRMMFAAAVLALAVPDSATNIYRLRRSGPIDSGKLMVQKRTQAALWAVSHCVALPPCE